MVRQFQRLNFMDNQIKIIEQLCVDAGAKLLEHVDAVRIFVTFHDGDKSITKSYTHGAGNFYAQLGIVSEWLLRQEEQTRKDTFQDQE